MTQNTNESMPELITALMADVERLKVLKEESAATTVMIRARQQRLASMGVRLDFADLEAPVPVSSSNATIVHPVIPPRTDAETRYPIEPADDELASPEPLVRAEPIDTRPAAQIAKEAYIQPSAGDVATFQTSIASSFERVIAAGFADAADKAAKFKGANSLFGGF